MISRLAHILHHARRNFTAISLATVILLFAAAGCGTNGGKSNRSSASKPLNVFAASSLTDVLPTIDPKARYQFAGSDQLAMQIHERAPADVFAAANSKLPDQLHEQGVVEKPVAFAANHIVLVVPKDSKIMSLQDLVTDRSAVIVMARPGVPLGDYMGKVLEALNAAALEQRAVSLEPDARSVTAKLVLGSADAGFVYVTDARSAGAKLRAIELPTTAVNHATYEVAIVTASKRRQAAQAYVDRLLSSDGRAALKDAGFDLP